LHPFLKGAILTEIAEDVMSALQNIQAALDALMGESESLTGELAAVLDYCRRLESITFEQVTRIVGAETGELLLLAWDWKLLIPRRVHQCAEWDDRILLLQPGERYDLVNLVRWLLASAAESGAWDPSPVIEDLYDHMGEPESAKIPALVHTIVRKTRGRRISGAGIQAACVGTGLGHRTGAMIAILKGGGVISPGLMSSSPRARTGSPIYDVHPVLCRLYAEGPHGS
jgi:hypothetical protein